MLEFKALGNESTVWRDANGNVVVELRIADGTGYLDNARIWTDNYNQGGTGNLLPAFANDYNTYLVAMANDYSTYSILLNISNNNNNFAHANDYSTYSNLLNITLSNDLATYLVAMSNDHSTLLSARSNDYSTYLNAMANDYNLYQFTISQQANIYLAALSNDYNTYNNVIHRFGDYVSNLIVFGGGIGLSNTATLGFGNSSFRFVYGSNVWLDANVNGVYTSNNYSFRDDPTTGLFRVADKRYELRSGDNPIITVTPVNAVIGNRIETNTGTISNAALQITGLLPNTALSINRFAPGSTGGPYLVFSKSRASTPDTRSTISVNDSTGVILFQGDDGNLLRSAAGIATVLEQVVANTSVSSRIELQTAEGNQLATRVILRSNGILEMNASMPIRTSAGNASSPSYSFTNAPTSGFYANTNAVLASVNGSTALTVVPFGIEVGTPGGTSASFIEIGRDPGADRSSYIDFISDSTYTDYSFRIQRAAGSSGNSSLLHRGPGDIRFQTQDVGANISFLVQSSERWRFERSNLYAVVSTATIQNQLGTAALPSYTFVGDLNTGIFSPGADSLAFTVGGIRAITMNPSELFLRPIPGPNIKANLIIGRSDNDLRYHRLEFNTFTSPDTNYMDFYIHDGVTTTSTRRALSLRGSGTVLAGNAQVATNATDGFLYIPTTAGTPTGTPTTQTGYVPIVFNTSNNSLHIYAGGSWIVI